MQHLAQNRIGGNSGIDQSLVETSNRAAIHFLVLPVPAVHLDDSSFVAVGSGIHGRSSKCLSPVSCEPLYVLRMEAVAEGMGYHLVCHYATMPRAGKAVQAVASARRFKDSLHVAILTIDEVSLQ